MNGSRNPAASPTSSQPSPARRRHAGGRAGPRPRSHRSARGARQATGSSAAGGIAASTAPTDGRRPSRSQPLPATRRPSTIPTLTRPPGTGREPDVAAVEQDHPRVARRVRSRDRRHGTSAPTRGAEPRPAGRRRAPRATTDRSPSAPTMTRASMRRRRPVEPTRRARDVDAGDRPRRAGPPRRRAARASSSGGSSADRSSPTAGAPSEPSSPYVSRNRVPAGGLDPHRRDRPGDAASSPSSSPSRAQRVDRRRRGEHAAGPPATRRRPLQRGRRRGRAGRARSRGPRRPDRRRRSGRRAAPRAGA